MFPGLCKLADVCNHWRDVSDAFTEVKDLQTCAISAACIAFIQKKVDLELSDSLDCLSAACVHQQ